MTAKTLLTINYRIGAAEDFKASFSDAYHYLFVGDHINSNTIVQPYDNPEDTLINAYYGMIFGKKIYTNDVNMMIRRVDWTSGTIYSMYDHNDPNLYDSDFYVIVHEGSQYDVFKCLENGGGAASTVSPSRTNVGSENDDFYYPNDGYRWKYMFSVTDAEADKFATSEYFPIVPDATVSGNALKGSIDVINVVTAGSGYANYINGSFSISDIRLNGDPKKYGITASGVNTSNGFYDGCWLYISSGAGAGQYRKIESYASNNTHNYITLNSAFDPSDDPENGSVFEISPSITIKGDGLETDGASARAIIDPNGNTVSRVEMLNKGLNYNSATAEVVAANSVGVTVEAGVVPIISPNGGHGYDSKKELGAKYVGVSVTVLGDEYGTIPKSNDYSQIGLIKNPEFNKIAITLANNNREFSTNEYVYNIETTQLSGTANTVLDGNSSPTAVITLNSVIGGVIAEAGDILLVNSGSDYTIANVVSVSNTSITLDKNVLFSTGTSTANIHKVSIKATGLIDGYSTGEVVLTNTTGEFISGDIIIGATTGTYSEVDVVTINSAQKTYDTFIGCHTYIGSMTQGTFTEDEEVYQTANTVAKANFHSITPDFDTGTSRIYVTNQIGTINTSTDPEYSSSDLVGTNSGAIATLTNKYSPDLVFGSGDILYLENNEAIDRTEENSETFKLIFEF